jgi:hypothetical protein
MNSLCRSASRPLPCSATVPSSLNTVKEPTAFVIFAAVATSALLRAVAIFSVVNTLLVVSAVANAVSASEVVKP